MQVALLRKIPLMPNSYKLGVIIAIFFIVFSTGYFWNIVTLKSQYNEEVKNEGLLLNQYQQLLRLKAKLSYQVEKIPELNAQFDKWQKVLVPRKDLPELLNDILNQANKSGLYISMFDPGEVLKDQFFSKINIQTILVGHYSQVAGFVSDLVNSPHLIVVEKMVIEEKVAEDLLGKRLAETAKRQGLLTVQLNLAVYFRNVEGLSDEG